MFLKNCWYVAGWGSEIGTAPLARKICGEPVVHDALNARRAADADVGHHRQSGHAEDAHQRAMMIRFVAVLALAAALVGCGGPESPAPATRTEPVATGVAYQHVPSGMLFPPKIGGFERTNVYPGRAGSDGVTVGYAFLTPSGPMLVTVTIEASPPGSAATNPVTISAILGSRGAVAR